MRLFKKQRHNQVNFKRLIHRLSGMSEADLYKVNQLLDVVFDSTSQSTSDVKKAPQEEPTLDETITEAKNMLKTEQLEKRIEQFRQAKKPKNE